MPRIMHVGGFLLIGLLWAGTVKGASQETTPTTSGPASGAAMPTMEAPASLSDCVAFRQICQSEVCGLDCSGTRRLLPCDSKVFQELGPARVEVCRPSGGDKEVQRPSRFRLLGLGLGGRFGHRNLDQRTSPVTTPFAAPVALAATVAPSRLGSSPRDLRLRLEGISLEGLFGWRPGRAANGRLELAVGLGRDSFELDSPVPGETANIEATAGSLHLGFAWTGPFCTTCESDFRVGAQWQTSFDPSPGAASEAEVRDLDFQEGSLAATWTLGPRSWRVRPVLGAQARWTDLDLRLRPAGQEEGEVERASSVRLRGNTVAAMAGLATREDSRWQAGALVASDGSDVSASLWLRFRPQRSVQRDACVTDADCQLGRVCETARIGECDSPERHCVAGCRVGERGCAGGLTCFDAVCKTCPCPDRCEPLLEQTCGFRGAPPCPGGTFCQWGDDDPCGRIGLSGRCLPQPSSCQGVPGDVVCGCDGVAYRNSCVAHLAGVAVASSGLCEDNEEPESSCPNGDLEFGNLEGWEGFTGNHKPGFLGSGVHLSPSGIVAGRHTRMPDPPDYDDFDPQVDGSILPVVHEGAYALRLGNANTHGEAESVRYTFEVTDANKDFRFSYAVVLEDYGHRKNQQPFFSYRVWEGDGDWPSIWHFSKRIDQQRVVADAGNPYFKNGPGIVVYRKWTPVCLDLSSRVGKKVTVEFTTADCSEGGHFGYAYIDGLCQDNSARAVLSLPPKACRSALQILADGTASERETDHFWSIEKSDAQWGRNPETEVSRWFIAEQAGVVDLHQLYQELGGQFECNTYYRIKLAVRNDCTAWDEDVKLLFIQCPEVDAGPDHDLCCGQGGTVHLGTPPQPGNSYQWSSEPAGFTAQTAQVTVSPTSSTRYHLEVTDADGCQAEDTADVLVFDDFTLESVAHSPADWHDQCHYLAQLEPQISIKDQGCNDEENPQLAAIKQGKWTYAWSTGETTPSIQVDPSEPTLYSVEVSNACFADTTRFAVEPCPSFRSGSFPELVYPNAFSPNGDGKNDIFQVFHLGLAAGARPAYESLGWKFRVWDRWGREVVNLEGETNRCEGFANGEIPNWDGRATHSGKQAVAGKVLPLGVYTWGLWLENCANPYGQQVITHQKCTSFLFWTWCKTKEFGKVTVVQ